MPDGPVNVLAEDSPDPEVALPPPSPPATSGRGRKKGGKAKEEVELIVTPIDPVHIVMYTYAQVGGLTPAYEFTAETFQRSSGAHGAMLSD